LEDYNIFIYSVNSLGVIYKDGPSWSW